MKITIFGANGQIGQHVVEQALQAGHQVTAYTRRPNALDKQHGCFCPTPRKGIFQNIKIYLSCHR